jgi:hypothetical protein
MWRFKSWTVWLSLTIFVYSLIVGKSDLTGIALGYLALREKTERQK